jgi:site-specific DNA recombinase
MVHPQATRASENQAIAEPQLGQSLERTPAERRQRASAEQFDSGALLAGLIFDETGRPWHPIRVNQGVRRYRFYLSPALQQREEVAGLRLPAQQLEKLVLETRLEASSEAAVAAAGTGSESISGDRQRSEFLIAALLEFEKQERSSSMIRGEAGGMPRVETAAQSLGRLIPTSLSNRAARALLLRSFRCNK